MSDNKKPLRPSDFSLRDIPGYIVIYIFIAAASVGLGLLVEKLPDFWRGVLLGSNIGLIAALAILRPGNRKQSH